MVALVDGGCGAVQTTCWCANRPAGHAEVPGWVTHNVSAAETGDEHTPASHAVGAAEGRQAKTSVPEISQYEVVPPW